MQNKLINIALSNGAIYIPNEWVTDNKSKSLDQSTVIFIANCNKLGFTLSEEALHRVNRINLSSKWKLIDHLKVITGVNKNWTPLVKQWDIPTGESIVDHIYTFLATLFNYQKGTKLECGHIIPFNTFPLERYNGCPYCGSQFEYSELEYQIDNSKLRVLELWTDEELKQNLINLLKSPIALDKTQIENLKSLLKHFDFPSNIEIKMKETLMIVLDYLISCKEFNRAQSYFNSAKDILRYLWYKHTGFLQIIEPRIIIKRTRLNNTNWHFEQDKSISSSIKIKNKLKLKYSREECRIYASWMNSLPGSVESICQDMHSKRGIWVRIIRALRLAEYSKKEGYENLAKLMDVFYNESYQVWQGKVDYFKLKSDEENTFKLLKQRPGLFARSLFSLMIWFGPDKALKHFNEIVSEIPTRLIFSLNMYADMYFEKNARRVVKPLGGTNKRIPTNKYLEFYSDEEIDQMKKEIQNITLGVMKWIYAKQVNNNSTYYIEPQLFNIPVSIGDRIENIQDLPSTSMGSRFKLEGEVVRLFLQWGNGLPAQHLDMDLSCSVAYENKVEYCSYSQLVINGCKHSGDIQHIPNKVGTAEYIDINFDELKERNAKYVTFTCNAYTSGSLDPNLIVGWMNSKYPMKVNSSGVAFNPSQVQHQIRVSNKLAKGMVFGVLDIQSKEIVWVEMSFGTQIIQGLDIKGVESMIKKLDSKLKIGELLTIKAESQGLKEVDSPELADEIYDTNLLKNIASLNRILMPD